MRETVVYVVATSATEAFMALKATNRFHIADMIRAEEDEAKGVEHKVYAIDEDRTVAVALSSTGGLVDVAIEVPRMGGANAERLGLYFLKTILREKRGLF